MPDYDDWSQAVRYLGVTPPSEEEYEGMLADEQMAAYEAEQYEAMWERDVANGGQTISAVLDIIKRHYGLEVICQQTGRTALVYMWTPTRKIVAAFSLRYDGERWIFEHCRWQDRRFQQDWLDVKHAIADAQK